MELALLPLVLGINLLVWSLIGGIRLTADRLAPVRRARAEPSVRMPVGMPAATPALAGLSDRSPATLPEEPPDELFPGDVAVVIPAHNEEPVIGATIASVLRLVPAANVHVVADACSDATAQIARSADVQVLELTTSHGKAGAIETTLEHFDIPGRFAAVLIVDADTIVDEHFLQRGLPMLDRPGTVALAGYAKAGWRPRELTVVGQYMAAYRTRLYTIMQWLKYAQTWRWTNVTPIVPGFASLYRTRALTRMDLNPAGLVIEDFNMTFEIHHKRLGKIAFHPSVNATTQEPDNLGDYLRQIKRWNLGFWQTLRRHGLWPSGFCAALVLFVTEVLVASIAFVLIAGAILLTLATTVLVAVGLPATWLVDMVNVVDFYLPLASILLFVVVPDYVLTCLTAIVTRRPRLLVYGVGFMALRMVDAGVALLTLPQAWIANSTGAWTSPTRRRAIAAPAADDGDDDLPESDDPR